MSEVIVEKTVDQWLNDASYVDDPNYVPSEFAIEFVTFIKMVNGADGEENKTPVLHYKMLDQVDIGESRIANMVFRGAAKTTVLGEYLFLYLAVYGGLPKFGRIELALYVSDSIDNGVKNMRKNLEFRYDNSDFLKKWVPKANFTDIRWAFENVDGMKFIVKGYGAKTGVRGSKEMGKRPKLAVLDDLVSDEDARSATVIESIEATVYKAVNYALHPKGNMIIWSGTPFNSKDPLYKAVESGAWKVNVYPVCEHFPCTRAEFRGAWPDRFTYDYVLDQYTKAKKAGMAETFNQELMLRIMSEDDRLVQDSEIGWYKHKNVIDNNNKFNFYITTDFATGSKQSNDFSVISVWAYSHNEDWYWVDGICAKQDMGKNIDDLFRMASKWKPMGVGIEVSGQQGGFIPWIQNEMMRRNIYFSLSSDSNSNAPGIKPTTNKMQRFMVVLPLFKMNKIKFPIELKHGKVMSEMLSELQLAAASGFRSKHDDFIDTISMLMSISPFAPSEVIDVEYDAEHGVWGVADHEKPDGLNSLASYTV